MLTELNGILDRLGQGPSRCPQRTPETSDTSEDESDKSKGRRKVLSEKTFRMKKSYGADELWKCFATGPKDAAVKPRHFCFRV